MAGRHMSKTETRTILAHMNEFREGALHLVVDFPEHRRDMLGQHGTDDRDMIRGLPDLLSEDVQESQCLPDVRKNPGDV